MKPVTVAVAALLGAASAHEGHARLHARSTWADWNASATTTTSSIAVDPTTASSSTWSDWEESSATPVDPVSETSTSSSVSWGEWDTSSTTPVDPATTSSVSTVWGEWEESSTTPVDPVASTTTTWGEWDPTSSVTDAVPASTKTTWAEWEEGTSTTVLTSTTTTTLTIIPADPTSTWAEWIESSTAIPVDPTTTDPTKWAEWTESSTATAVDPTSTGATTWAEWTESSTTSPAAAKVTGAYTSTVPAAWSSNGWFGPSFTVDPVGQCAVQVVTSYGHPTWYPTPEAPTTTSTSTADPSTWAEWVSSSTTTKLVDPVTTSSVSSSTTWAEWIVSSSTTTKPVDPVVTSSVSSSTTWAEWVVSSSTTTTTTKRADPSSTSSSTTWAEWSYSSVSTFTTSASSAFSTGFASSSTSSAGWSKPSGGSPGITTNGNKWSMTYSPYTAEGGCKDSSVVYKDIAVLAAKGFTSVRVYSTDCSTLENVGGAARASGIKIILGVFISGTGISGAKPQVDDIVAWAQWDLVELIVVGNEAVYQGHCSPSDLAGFISSSKWAFKNAGYTGLVTTTEPLLEWQNDGHAFCDVVDVVAGNLYAFFNPNTPAEKAGEFIQSQIEILSQICPGKDTYVMESGWPSAGNCNGVACPSPENQATAIKGIQSLSGAKVVFFSFEDEAWKEPGEFGVEQHWGCGEVF